MTIHPVDLWIKRRSNDLAIKRIDDLKVVRTSAKPRRLFRTNPTQNSSLTKNVWLRTHVSPRKPAPACRDHVSASGTTKSAPTACPARILRLSSTSRPQSIMNVPIGAVAQMLQSSLETGALLCVSCRYCNYYCKFLVCRAFDFSKGSILGRQKLLYS